MSDYADVLCSGHDPYMVWSIQCPMCCLEMVLVSEHAGDSEGLLKNWSCMQHALTSASQVVVVGGSV